MLSEWRATWNVNSLVRSKRQGTLIGFVWFCERRGWFPRNFAADVTQGLGKIQVKATQTGYFRPEETRPSSMPPTFAATVRASTSTIRSPSEGSESERSRN